MEEEQMIYFAMSPYAAEVLLGLLEDIESAWNHDLDEEEAEVIEQFTSQLLQRKHTEH